MTEERIAIKTKRVTVTLTIDVAEDLAEDLAEHINLHWPASERADPVGDYLEYVLFDYLGYPIRKYNRTRRAWLRDFGLKAIVGAQVADLDPTYPTALFTSASYQITPGALQAFRDAGADPRQYLARHFAGDWASMPEEDQKANDHAIGEGSPIYSSYTLPNAARVWIITPADRSVTTITLPKEN